MALILSIETATMSCSVALHQDGNLLGVEELFLEKSHSKYLVPLIKNLMNITGMELNELKAVAISKGPGSYTGLRIGTSTAKGICYSLDIPLISINTLQAMALTVAGLYNNVLLCPMIDARRMEVYYLITNNNLEEIEPTRSQVIDENAYKDLLSKHDVVFFGNGLDKCKAILSKHSRAIFVDSVYPTAKSVGKLASEKYKSGQFENLAYFEPFYLKEFLTTKAGKLF